MLITFAVAADSGRVKVPRDICHDAFDLQFHRPQLIRPMLSQELQKLKEKKAGGWCRKKKAKQNGEQFGSRNQLAKRLPVP
jgi:hypothetical protein